MLNKIVWPTRASETDILVHRYRHEKNAVTPRIKKHAYREVRSGCAPTRIRHRKRCALNKIRHRKTHRNARLRSSGNEYTQRYYYRRRPRVTSKSRSPTAGSQIACRTPKGSTPKRLQSWSSVCQEFCGTFSRTADLVRARCGSLC
jgi:hypothetical protein